MTKLPDRLSRKAVKQFFTKIPESRWDHWFKFEKENGIHALRVPGPFDKAYYSGPGIKEWLLSEGHYSPKDFEPSPQIGGGWSGLTARRHAIVG